MTTAANEAILESWALSLHAKSPGTKALYLRVARWFAAWLAANGRPVAAPGDLLAVARQDSEAWLAAQRTAGLKPTTLRSRWIALRSLYRWLTEEDEIPANPMARVQMSKVQPDPIRVLSTDELRAVLKVCDGAAFHPRRDAALIRFMVATGGRLAETAGLKIGDVDLAKRVAYVRGKGDKARFVRFDPATAAAMDRYRRVRGRHPHGGLEWFWLARAGRLTDKGIPIMLRRRARQAGLDHLHAHQLRHTWADRLKSAGMADSDVMMLGGWENADVMRRYGSARAVDRALAAYDEANPLEGL